MKITTITVDVRSILIIIFTHCSDPSVRPLNAWLVTKRKEKQPTFLHHMKGWRILFWDTEIGRLGVLKTWVLVSRRLETPFYKSWSRSWS